MTPVQYFLLAFVITMLLLLGYPLWMWLESRNISRREAMSRPKPDANEHNADRP